MTAAAVLPAARPYEPRWGRPSVLQQVLRAELPRFVAEVEQAERSVPDFVTRELWGIAHCGDPERGGLTRWRCPHCAWERVLVFRCKSSVCPTCAGRRMAEKTELLLEVLPRVPIRQFVVTFPPSLRYLMSHDAGLTGLLTSAVVHSVFSWQRHRAKQILGLARVGQAHGAAVTSVQRARSDLRASVHLHVAAFDGVFVEPQGAVEPKGAVEPQGAIEPQGAVAEPQHGESRAAAPTTFHALPPPEPQDLEHIARDIVRRATRALERRGLCWDPAAAAAEGGGGAEVQDPVADEQPLLAQCCTDSMLGRITMGAGRGAPVDGVDARPRLAVPKDLRRHNPAVAEVSGLNLHAGTRVAAHDRKGLGRLLRYILRPPIATERLTWTADGRLRYRLKRRNAFGRDAIEYGALDFVAKLVPLVPRPRFNEIRYHGLLAPAARLRGSVLTPRPSKSRPPRQLGLFRPRTKREDAERPFAPNRCTFARLMRSTFDVDIETCERCGRGPLRYVGPVTDPAAIEALLAATAAAPPTQQQQQTHLARAPPQLELTF